MSVVTQAATTLDLTPDEALDEPLARLLALSACNSYNQGLEVAGATYTDKEIERILLKPKPARPRGKWQTGLTGFPQR